jgi:uncharacterized protein involved in outer membrane biogenesis
MVDRKDNASKPQGYGVKRLLIAGAALLVVLVTALFVVPLVIDWSSYAPQLTAKIEARLGRKLAIDGAIDVQILPSPRLVARDVRLANLPGATEADMARLKRLEADLSFGALFSGRLETKRITLIDPVITLERLADGRANWNFEPLAKPATQPAKAGAPKAGVPNESAAPGSPAEDEESPLEAVAVRNGTVIFHNPGQGALEVIDGITAELTRQPETGRYQADGRLRARGVSITLKGSLGAPTKDGTQSLSMDAVIGKGLAHLQAEGALADKDGALEIAADAELNGDSLATTADTLKLPLPGAGAALDQPFDVKGAVGLRGDHLDIRNLQLRLGTLQANGAFAYVSGTPPQIDLLLAFGRLDLDALIAEATKSGGADGSTRHATKEQPANRDDKAAPKAAADARRVMQLPTDLTASVNCTIDALIYRGGLIRSTQIILSLDNGVITVQQASAELPGGGDIALFGQLAERESGFAFDGQMDLAADDLRALLGWLKLDVGHVPSERLRRLHAKTKLALSPGHFSAPALDLTLDTTHLTGTLAIDSPADPATISRVAADLTLDRLALDAYLPQAKDTTEAMPNPSAGDAPPVAKRVTTGKHEANESAPANDDFETWLDRHELAGQLKIGWLHYGDAEFHDVQLNPLWHDGVLTIADLSVRDVLGARVKASLTAHQPFGDAAASVALELAAPQPGALLRALGLADAVRADALGAIAVKARLEGNRKSFELDGTLIAPLGRFVLTGQIKEPLDALDYALDVSLSEATDTGLRSLFGAANTGKASHAVSAAAHLTGDATSLHAEPFALEFDTLRFAGTLDGRLDGPRPYVKLALAGTDEVGHSSGGETGAPPDAAEPTETAGEIRTPARPAVIHLDSETAAPPRGGPREHWSRERFDLEALRRFDADLTLARIALDGNFGRLDQLSVTAALKDGTLDIRSLRGRLFDGDLQASGRIELAGGPDFKADFQLAGADIAAALAAFGKAEAATGRANIEGALRAKGANEYALIASLGGTLQIAAQDGTIEGIDLNAIRASLRDLEELGDFAGLARGGLSGGQTRLERLNSTIALKDGIAHTEDTTVTLEGGTGRITGNADLPRWLVDLDTRFQLAEPKDVPELALKLRGPLDRPERLYRLDPVIAWLGARLVSNPEFLPKIGIKLRKGAKAEPGSAIDAALKGVFGNPDQPATEPAPAPAPSAPVASGPTTNPAPAPTVEPKPESEPAKQAPAPRLLDLLKKVLPE